MSSTPDNHSVDGQLPWPWTSVLGSHRPVASAPMAAVSVPLPSRQARPPQVPW
jgi:hypothetical protein